MRLQKLRHPLAHSHDWYTFSGPTTVRPLWDGRGQVQYGTLQRPDGKINGLTVRIYDTKKRQWMLYWATPTAGMQTSPQVGTFDANGIGQFYAPDTFNGKAIIVRYKWTRNFVHPHFEQAYSSDGGKAWETNWITDYTRASSPVVAQTTPHDFDFLNGKWKAHYTRLRHPLAHSHDWYGFDASDCVYPMWDGSGQMEDGDLRSPLGRILGLTVRLYNEKTHEWSLYWGTSEIGIPPGPQVGHFDANGVGLFYAPDVWHGQKVLVRYKWTHASDHPHFEQAFSTDNGKTWETNWTTDYTRG
jgi:hypothetical protein